MTTSTVLTCPNCSHSLSLVATDTTTSSSGSSTQPSNPPPTNSPPPGPALLNKIDVKWVPNAVEATPIIWNNQILVAYNPRKSGNLAIADSGTIYFKEWTTGNIVASCPSQGLILISAIVYNSKIYIFGSDTGNSVLRMMSSTDLVHWQTAQTVMGPFPGYTIYNSSVTQDATGFMFAVEHTGPGFASFDPAFYHCTNLDSPSFAGSVGNLLPNQYTACPTIRYMSDGYYYCTYLVKSGGQYKTTISRSQTCKTSQWTNSQYYVIQPTLADEGINTSDMDLCEFNGQTYVVYADGDQATWADIRQATWNWSNLAYLQSFF